MKVVITKTVERIYKLADYENYKPSFTVTEEFEIGPSQATPEWYADQYKRIGKIIDAQLVLEKQKIQPKGE